MPGNLLELAPHLKHHRARRPSHRGHAERAEEIRQEPADEEADHHIGVLQREADGEIGKVMMQILGVGGEQDERGQSGGADRIALGHRLGRVADGVERVRCPAHVLGQVGHLGDAAGIVGDRAVGVERDDHAGQGQHRHRGNGDAEEPGEQIGDDDAAADDDDRKGRRLHRDREPLDHVGAVSGDRLWAMLRTGRYSVDV